jgi:CubicO group peptidase (beta-lactamase class C family)
MRRSRFLRLLLSLIATIWITVAHCAESSFIDEKIYPGKSWEAVPTNSFSLACQQDLDATRSYLRTLDTTALLAVHDGKVLFSYGPVDLVSIIFSARKSILSMMYGKYVQDGTIDLEQTIGDLGIDDIGGLLPVEREAKIRNLLTARSGVYHLASNSGDDLASAPPRESQIPGTYFLYNNWDFNAAGTVFESLTKRSIYRAFATDFAAPLEFEDFDLTRQHRSGDQKKSRHLAYNFFLSTRDMARLGYLMLQNGKWRGNQIIPAEWVVKSTTAVTASVDMHPPHVVRRHFGYSYLWWTLEDSSDSRLNGAYMAWGIHGQYILVIPKRHMAIAHKRQVPVKGNWDVSWVQANDFLNAARMLATAPCQ